jgi:DNA-binding beta-propeller fold protein YncE
MPHGLTIDHDGNYWLTDVALHQVLKFSPNNLTMPNLILGKRLQNGQDSAHFCKPTDVAVSSRTGDIFVSDGYCNSRVVQFDRNGNYIREFKMPIDEKQIFVSHSIALIEDNNLVCVADRENGRIICFDIQIGDVKSIIEHPKMSRVFAIEYDKNNNLLYAVSGATKSIEPLGFTFNMDSGKVFGDLLNIWKPKDSVSLNMNTLYL